jgi:hypothetical protein
MKTAARGVPAKPQDEKAHWAGHAVPYEVHQHHRTGSSAPPLEASPPGDTERVFGDMGGVETTANPTLITESDQQLSAVSSLSVRASP